MRKNKKDKFKFGIDFQELILQYTVTDPSGFKTLSLLEDSYFTLIHHQIIAYSLKKYYKQHKHVPEETYLREFLRSIYERDKIFDITLTEEDTSQISEIIKRIYDRMVSQPTEIINKCVDFARYVKFKEELEEVDINNFDSYEAAISKLKAANNIGIDLQKNYGTFLVGGINDRAHKRNMSHLVNPTPFWQINKLLNSGGLTRGSVICYMGKEKRFKTGMLLNTAKGYLRMRKRIWYADFENGENSLTVRLEQSISGQTQETITSESHDDKLLKTFRKYKRLGAEIVIKRFSALTDNMGHVEIWLDELEKDFGLVFDAGFVDYGVLCASISGKQDEFGRISDSFLDIKNLAEKKKYESIWTAAHITREGDKRTKSKYVSTDIAKCIDIPRHVDAVFGLQENDQEMEAGVMRVEVIEQRNGMREGNALFWLDIPKQIAKEFNKKEVYDYRDQAGENETGGKIKKERKADL